MPARLVPAVLLVTLAAGPAPGQEPHVLKAHRGWVGSLAFSPDGKLIASGGADRTVRIWDVRTGKELRAFRGHADAVCGLAHAEDGRTLATASHDGTARLWDVATGEQWHSFKGHRGVVMAVALSPDGRTLASAGMDGTVRVWDAGRGKKIATLKGHRSWVNGVCFTPDGHLVTGSSDDTVRLWSRKDGQWAAALVKEVPEGEVRSVAVSPDGRLIAAGIRYGTVRVWDRDSGKEVAGLKGHPGDAWAVAFSPDGGTLAVGAGDWDRPGEVRLWQVKGWEQAASLRHTGEVLCVAWSPDGRRLAAGGWNGDVLVWDLDGKPGGQGPVSPKGEVIRLFSGKDLSGLYPWLKKTGKDDPKGVFRVRDGVIHVSGRDNGYLATDRAYRDYKLVVEYRWGKETFGSKYVRNSGILLHAVGPDGGAGGVWMSSIEVQLAQGCVGDLIVIRGKDADGKVVPVSITSEVRLGPDRRPRWSEGGEKRVFTKGQLWWSKHDPDYKELIDTRGRDDVESRLGEWTKVECVCRGGRISVFVNGVHVNECFDASPAAGKILLQSEGFEMEFRRFELHPLKE